MKYSRLISLVLILGILVSFGCRHHAKQPVKKESLYIKEYYTCPFHTDIMRADSGYCPKCGHKLVKIVQKLSDKKDSGE